MHTFVNRLSCCWWGTRFALRARGPSPLAPDRIPSSYSSKPRAGRGRAPGPTARAGLPAPPAEPEEGPSCHGQVSRGWGDPCRPQRKPEDPHRRAGPLGPAGTPSTPPQLRWPSRHQVGWRAPANGAARGLIRSKGERQLAPSPYLEQVQVSPRNPIGAAVLGGGAPRAPWGVSASASRRWPAGNRAPAVGEGRRLAAPAPTAGHSAPAPRPPPPAGAQRARARFGVFAPLESKRRGRKCPSADGEAGRLAGLSSAGRAGPGDLPKWKGRELGAPR